MSVVSVHIADVGFPKSLRFIRPPRPASVPGLLQANAGVAATFGTAPGAPVADLAHDAETQAAAVLQRACASVPVEACVTTVLRTQPVSLALLRQIDDGHHETARAKLGDRLLEAGRDDDLVVSKSGPRCRVRHLAALCFWHVIRH